MNPVHLPARLMVATFSVVFAWSCCGAEIVLEKDLVYGKGGETELKLDLARPKDGDGPFPALVLIHAVLPVPVCAQPSKSFCCNTTGMACC